MAGCPDCNPNGDSGVRCPEHQIEYLQMEIKNHKYRIRILRKVIKNQTERINSELATRKE